MAVTCVILTLLWIDVTLWSQLLLRQIFDCGPAAVALLILLLLTFPEPEWRDLCPVRWLVLAWVLVVLAASESVAKLVPFRHWESPIVRELTVFGLVFAGRLIAIRAILLIRSSRAYCLPRGSHFLLSMILLVAILSIVLSGTSVIGEVLWRPRIRAALRSNNLATLEPLVRSAGWYGRILCTINMSLYIVLLGSIFALLRSSRRAQVTYTIGQACPSCGYPARGPSTVCSECACKVRIGIW
jgi:hypothetical protein